MSQGIGPMPAAPTPAPPGTAQRFVPAGDAVDVSVIIVNYNTAHLLDRCIGNLRLASQSLAVQLVIVDNASRDGSAALVGSRFPDAMCIANGSNVGFGRAANQGLAHSTGKYLLLLNADAYLCGDTLHKSLAHLREHPECGALGVRSVDESGRELQAGRSFPTPWKNFKLQTGLFPGPPAPPRRPGPVMDCDWVVGCYYLLRREVIDRVGPFDPRYFLYFEEVDHCRSVSRAGWRVQCLLDTQVVHVGGGAAESDGALGGGRQLLALQTESSLLYFRKHGGLAGVLLAAALLLATDAVLAAKRLLKHRKLEGLKAHWASASQLCSLLLRTRAGAAPTR